MPLRYGHAEPITVAYCAHCRGEIYAGDEVCRIDSDGRFVHNGWGDKCAAEYATERVYDALGTINEREEIE